MSELFQQLAWIDALLSNWDAIRIRMGLVTPALDAELANLAARLMVARSPDQFAVILDELLDITMETPANLFVRDLMARSSVSSPGFLGTRGTVSEMVIETIPQTPLLDLGHELGQAISAPTSRLDVPVFFATNRKRMDRELLDDQYSREPGESLNFGQALVSIPVAVHQTGKLELPAWWSLFPDKGNRERYFVIGDVEDLQSTAFLTRLARVFECGQADDLLVFLHGFNVTFEKALRHAAQFAHDLRFRGAVVLFSWPSLGKLLGYSADEDRAAIAAEWLAKFLKQLEGGPWRNIHLVAHSMGNRVLVLGLADNPPPRIPLQQVVMVAADIQEELFQQKFAKISLPNQPLTSYASKTDRALLMSWFLHKTNRIGFIEDEPFVTDGMETVDATAVDTGLWGHSYFSDQRSVITDLGYLLANGLRARDRPGLEPVVGKKYWRFPR